MRKLSRFFEKRIELLTGLDREEIRKAVFASAKQHPEMCIYFDGVEAKVAYGVAFPPCRGLPEGGDVLIPAEYFVKDQR